MLVDLNIRTTDSYRKGSDGLWVLHPFASGVWSHNLLERISQLDDLFHSALMLLPYRRIQPLQVVCKSFGVKQRGGQPRDRKPLAKCR